MNEAALEAYNKSIKKRASGAVWREKVDIAQVSISPPSTFKHCQFSLFLF
jgi:hypothetical protein